MQKLKTTLALASVLALSPTVVMAQSATEYGTVIGRISTLGFGLEYTYPLTDTLAAGVGLNLGSKSDTIDDSGVTYKGEIDWDTKSLLLHWNPNQHGFRVSGGIMVNGNELTLTKAAGGTGTFNIGGGTEDFTNLNTSIAGAIGFNSVAPYLGIGYAKAPKTGRGFSFDANLGVLFSGEPEVTLTGSCTASVAADGCGSGIAQADLDTALVAEKTKLEKDLSGFEFLPAVGIGISYAF